MREACTGEDSVNALRLGLQIAVEKGKAECAGPTERGGRAECSSLIEAPALPRFPTE